jgi:hypothetical protein
VPFNSPRRVSLVRTPERRRTDFPGWGQPSGWPGKIIAPRAFHHSARLPTDARQRPPTVGKDVAAVNGSTPAACVARLSSVKYPQPMESGTPRSVLKWVA